MAIAAGAKELARLSAALALVERHPAGLGTTRRDGIDDFAVSLGHGASVTLEMLGSKVVKISWMEVMIEFHHVVDQLAGIFLTFLGQVKIEHGGFEAAWPM